MPRTLNDTSEPARRSMFVDKVFLNGKDVTGRGIFDLQTGIDGWVRYYKRSEDDLVQAITTAKGRRLLRKMMERGTVTVEMRNGL